MLNSIATGATDPTTTAATAKSTQPSATDQQDRFLKLLVTQMKNQDPLAPMDNAQLTSQLAQISTVSGVESLNTTMKTLIDQIQGMQALQSQSMVGRDVLVSGNRIDLADGQAIGGFEVPDGADDVTVTIRGASGATIAQLPLGKIPAGVHQFFWDGAAMNGAASAAGQYSFTVDAKTAGSAVTANALSVGHVQGIIRGANGVQVDLGVLGTKAVDDVKEIL